MKKTILALLALGAFGMANAAPSKPATVAPITPVGTVIATQAAGDTGAPKSSATHAIINVTGKVLDNTCEINTDDRVKNVTLKTVGVNQLTKLGDVAADQLVQIRVENCKFGPNPQQVGSNNKTVTAAFRSTNKIDHYHNGTLYNLDEENGVIGAATKVRIQFSNLDGSSIRLGANDDSNKLKGVQPADQNGKAMIQFNARYYAIDQATAGSVKAEAELDLAYE